MSHIFTPDSSALIPIKCYSPEIIVHPAETSGEVVSWLKAIHSFVIGPGLGRNQNLEKYLEDVLKAVEEQENLKIVGDADFLYFLNNSEVLRDYVSKLASRVVLTPNKVEFERLKSVLNVSGDINPELEAETCEKISNAYLFPKG